MELKPYPDAKNPIGYVEDRKRGTRIIIVIDDFFNLPDWYTIKNSIFITESGLDTAGGLLLLYNSAREWESTRGIGFFNLPDPAQILEKSDEIINCIDQWLDHVCSGSSAKREDYDYYILVDIYFGKKYHIGSHFIDYWKQRRIVPAEKEKLAYFSTAGAVLGWEDPHQLQFFSKAKIDVTGRLTPDLEDWLDFVPVALDKVWEKSIGWFDDHKSDIIRHDFSPVKQWFLEQNPKAQKYQESIEAAFGFKFPETWWQDLEVAKNIHESLKHLCGEVFCGSTNLDGCRNISVGAAYIIALKAHYDRFKNIDALTQNPAMWKGVPKSTAAIFPIQSTKNAKASAIALYEFFYRIFEPRSGEGSPNDSQVKTAYFEQGGVVLKIQLHWNATKPAPDRSESLVQMLSKRFESNQIEVPDSPGLGHIAQNTRNAITQLWRTMMFNQNGFMSPGVIYMERDEIIIASTEYLVWGG